MSDANELYQQVILEHNGKPLNFGAMENATHQAEGNNPLCGDRFTVWLELNQHDTIVNASFAGHGCAISKASASVMTKMLKGKSREEAERIFDAFLAMMTDHNTEPSEILGELDVFAGVRAFPMRVKCATLPWHAAIAALHNSGTATTE